MAFNIKLALRGVQGVLTLTILILSSYGKSPSSTPLAKNSR